MKCFIPNDLHKLFKKLFGRGVVDDNTATGIKKTVIHNAGSKNGQTRFFFYYLRKMFLIISVSYSNAPPLTPLGWRVGEKKEEIGNE